MALSLTEFEKALTSLSKALALEKTDITRDASIQRFEFCVELAWKTSKKIMGTSTSAPKQVIREMAQAGLIEEVTFWLDSIEKRNLSAHTYKEELADIVYTYAKKFLPQAKDLLKRLEEE